MSKLLFCSRRFYTFGDLQPHFERLFAWIPSRSQKTSFSVEKAWEFSGKDLIVRAWEDGYSQSEFAQASQIIPPDLVPLLQRCGAELDGLRSGMGGVLQPNTGMWRWMTSVQFANLSRSWRATRRRCFS